MVRLGKKKDASAAAGQGWTPTPAEILDVKYGLVHTTSTGVDAMYDRHSASKKIHLRVEPRGAAPYEATLKIDRDGPSTPDLPGTRFDVLVDPGDAQQLALPADPTYTLPGGQTWQPEHGLAGEIAAAAKRGDTKEIVRLTALARAQSPAVSAGAVDPLDRIAKLAKLRDSGALTEQEFETEKAKILGST